MGKRNDSADDQTKSKIYPQSIWKRAVVNFMAHRSTAELLSFYLLVCVSLSLNVLDWLWWDGYTCGFNHTHTHTRAQHINQLSIFTERYIFFFLLSEANKTRLTSQSLTFWLTLGFNEKPASWIETCNKRHMDKADEHWKDSVCKQRTILH